MATATMTDPTQICEQTLRDRKAANIERNVWPSENVVIDHMLERRNALIEAYAEIHEKLHVHAWGIYTLFDVLLGAAVVWNPEKVAQAREARRRLEEVNSDIARTAQRLAELIAIRSDLGNSSGFASETLFHIVDVIDAASSENGFYTSHLQEKLQSLASRYDLKYWPDLAEMVQVIGDDACHADTKATDVLTRAATTGPRGSNADFFKALFVSLEENSARNHGHLPNGFKLSDETLASLASCLLDPGPDTLFDGAYVKRLRQRERKARKSES